MHTLKTTFATPFVKLVASSALVVTLFGSFPAHTAEPTRCTLHMTNTQTEFPAKSQSRGEHGLVRLALAVSADGRATGIAIAQSSGHKSLDKAAVRSVGSQWRFDVAHCTAAELAKPRTVDVTFVRAKNHTLASAIDVEAIAKIRTLAADTQCQQSTDEVGTAIFSCIKNTQANNAANLAAARNP